MIFCRGFILLLFINLKLVAQTFITDNDWDFHLNIRDPLHIVFFDDNIYSFSSNGLFSLDINSKAILRNNNSLNLINLKVVETTKNSEYLILGLQDGNIVIYNSEESHIINLGFDEEEAAINSLNIHDETLYASTSQGLYLISITEKYIIENYRDIGQNGSSLDVLESLIYDDKIYIISTTGVYVLYDNSLNPFDYRSWEKLNFNFDEPFGVVPNNGEIYFYSKSTIYDSSLSALYRDDDITIQKVKNINSGIYINYLNNNNNLLGSFKDLKIVDVDLPQDIKDISDFIYADGDLWVSGKTFSLYNVNSQQFFSPINNINHEADKIFSLGDEIYASNNNNISIKYQNEEWKNISFDNFKNITSVAKFNNEIYFSSSSDGILNYNKSTIIDESFPNSLLLNESGAGINIADILPTENKLMILNYGSLNPLLSLDINNNWQYYNLQNNSNLYPTHFSLDDEFLWILLDKNKGGGLLVFDMLTQECFQINENNNLLNTNKVNSISIDKNDNVWVATDEGLVYFSSSNPREFNNYLIPNDGNQFLFKGIKINTVEVDYAGNIWIGSDDGIFVFDNTKNKFVFQFNLSNSPILSDTIKNIKFNDLGEAFINTSEGLVSLKTSLSKPNIDISNFKIFPNPLKIKDNDRLYFTGLSNENYIKITSLTGEVIIELETFAGGFSWNLISADGNKISPGIYLVFLISQNGDENLINKILVL